MVNGCSPYYGMVHVGLHRASSNRETVLPKWDKEDTTIERCLIYTVG